MDKEDMKEREVKKAQEQREPWHYSCRRSRKNFRMETYICASVDEREQVSASYSIMSR